MRRLVVLLILAMFFLVCLEKKTVADYGDHVSVDYILTVDGKVIDTSIEEVAREAGIYTPTRRYIPLSFKVELNKYLINGFVKGIVGMEEGESKVFSVPPGPEGYGYHDPTKVYRVSRYYTMNALEVVPRSYFEERNIPIEQGTAFDTEKGTVFIENISGDNVTIMYVFHKGDSFDYNGFHHVVVGSYNLTYYIMLDVEENKSYRTVSLIDGKPVIVRVINLTNDSITFDENHPLAGKTLVYNVTLLALEKAG